MYEKNNKHKAKKKDEIKNKRWQAQYSMYYEEKREDTKKPFGALNEHLLTTTEY